MQATICKWGNSLALRLPRHVIEKARLVEGASVELEVEDGAIKVTPSRPRFSLAELLQPEKPEQEKPGEFDWGEPVGRERW